MEKIKSTQKPGRLRGLPPVSLLVAALILAQLACNFTPVGQAEPPTATAALPSATVTELPPSATATLAPPSATPPLPPTPLPTAVQTLNTPVPTAAQPTVAPTKPVVKPAPKARFAGQFTGGVFSFRTNDAGTYVTLKEITLAKAKCANGKTVSTHLTFEDISFFEIKAGSFNIVFDRTTISGAFATANTASGTIWIKINAAKGVCEIGPLGWTASAP